LTYSTLWSHIDSCDNNQVFFQRRTGIPIESQPSATSAHFELVPELHSELHSEAHFELVPELHSELDYELDSELRSERASVSLHLGFKPRF